MFRIKDIIMANFSRFEGVTIPLDGETSVFTGPNGSGKSTTFDAARLVLGSRKLANEKRDLLKEYLTHPHTYTVLAIVAYNRRKDGKPAIFRKLALKEEFVTLARVYIPKSQSVESKFLIFDGELAAEAILDRIEKSEGLGEQRYMDKLSTIGITLATLDQIIIRQGKVIEVTMGGAKQLHQKVMNHAGASDTMAEYRRARAAADEAGRKLETREDEYRKAARQLNDLETAVEAKKKYDRKLNEINECKTNEQAALVQADLIRLKKCEDSIPDLEKAIIDIQTDREQSKPDIETLDHALEEAVRRLADWDHTTADLAEEKRKVSARKFELDEPHARYVVARAELPALVELPATDQAERSAATAAKNVADATAFEQEKTRLFDDAHARYSALKAGKTPWPAPVAATLAALDAAGIPYSCLAHQLDPDPDHKPALEAALGPRRFAISVAPKHHATAISIAAKHAFPGPISTNESKGKHLATGVWNAAGETPEWTSTFELKEGRAQTQEGTWVALETHTLLGPEPTKEDISKAKSERDAAEIAKANAKRARETAQREQRDILDLLARCKQRDAHEATIRGAGDMPARYAKLVAELERLTLELTNRDNEKRRLTEDLKEARARVKKLKDTDGARAARLFQKETELATAREQIGLLTKSTERALIVLPDAARAKAKDLTAPLREPGAYQRLAKSLEDDLAAMKVPDQDVEAQHARFQARVRDYKARVDEQQETVRSTIEELDRARKQYAVFQTQHLEEYRKRFKTLADDFGIASSVFFTAIRHDSTDEEIDNAVLEVRTGYNGKEPTLVHGGGFSGGEEILNGLLLQLALRDLDSDGFIMVDQPYDHLDSVNAREVANYLSRAPMQVIIAVPSSLSPEHYHGMARGVLFQKAQGTGWAPLPEVVAVRGP